MLQRVDRTDIMQMSENVVQTDNQKHPVAALNTAAGHCSAEGGLCFDLMLSHMHLRNWLHLTTDNKTSSSLVQQNTGDR